jgi:hypothetical protein
MNVGNGPEDLPQFEDRFLYHLVDIAGDRPMGHTDGVPEQAVVACLADELNVAPEFARSNTYPGSATHDVVLGTIRELENEGLLTVPIKVTGPWKLRPSRDGRSRVAQWREGWERQRSKQDRQMQRLILQELQRQWRANPEVYKRDSRID